MFPGLPWLQFLVACSVEREGLGDLVLCSDIRWTEGRHKGGRDKGRAMSDHYN